jgi:choline dehydrogenase-like flavoprotein
MPSTVYDVVIVGSGAAGGSLASRLARAGAHVALVEGGPKLNTRTDFNTHAMPFEFANRHIPVMKPGKPGMDSQRTRGAGGKTQTWNAVAWRFSQRDFKGRDFDNGAGENWPLDYRDLAPYYDSIEREVGVCGNLDGLQDLPDGIFLPPVPMKCSDVLLQRGAARLGVKLIHVRKATLSRPKAGRPACHYCGNCMAGCDVVAKYNSYDTQIIPAIRQTGKLDLFTDTLAREVMISPENRVTGVATVHRTTRQTGEIRGKAVAVCCACVQSVGLLLMSKSRLYPNGLANSSGHLGRHFIPHFTGGIEFFLTKLIGTRPTAGAEGFLDHAYQPSFMHTRKRDYARSFGAQFGYQNRRAIGWARRLPGMGLDFKQSVRERFPAFVVWSPYGEKIPDAQSYIDLDPAKRDAWGLPEVRKHLHWNSNDWKIFRDMTSWGEQIVRASGGEILSVNTEPRPNHELGGARMGHDPKSSVVDAFCRAHDVPNLYVVDGSVFPSASEKNPTHTIMALAARAADHIIDRRKKGEL